MPNCKLTSKAHSTSSFMDFALSFSEYITIPSSEEALKMCQHNFFQEMKQKVVLLAIYLFNYDSAKSTLFIGIWHSLEYSFCQINENSSFLAILRDYKNILLFALCFEMYFFIKT